MEIGDFYFDWKVENFSFCYRNVGDYLESPKFVLPYGNRPWKEQLFSLQLYLRGTDGMKDTVTCILCNCNENDNLDLPKTPQDPLLNFKLSAMTRSEEFIVFQKGYILENFKVKFGNGIIGSRKDMLTHPSYSAEDVLTIRCYFSNGSHCFTLGECLARTHITIKSYSYTWDIKKHKSYYTGRQTSVSLLSLDLSLDSKYSGFCQVTSIKVKYKKESDISVIKCIVSFLNNLGELKNIGTLELNAENSFSDSISESFNVFDENSKSFICNDVLTLFYEIIIADGEELSQIDNIPEFENVASSVAGPSTANSSNSFPSKAMKELETKTIPGGGLCENLEATEEEGHCMTLLEDLRKLYSEHINSDFTLQVGDKALPVHKNILSARSPVFFAMFNSNMKEKESTSVDVPDVDSDTMDRLLRFAYFEHFKNLDCERAQKLYAAADKYQIDSLKSKCADYLASGLSLVNVCDVLLLADLHRDDRLKKIAKEYVFRHRKETFGSAEWKQLMMDNVLLASGVMHEVCLKFS